MLMFEALFKALGEPTRLQILRLLAEQELCVCDLEEILQISQPRISQHLKVLKQAGLVRERREAQRRICSFDREAFDNAMQAFNRFMQTPLRHLPAYSEINRRLLALDGRACERKKSRPSQAIMQEKEV